MFFERWVYCILQSTLQNARFLNVDLGPLPAPIYWPCTLHLFARSFVDWAFSQLDFMHQLSEWLIDLLIDWLIDNRFLVLGRKLLPAESNVQIYNQIYAKLCSRRGRVEGSCCPRFPQRQHGTVILIVTGQVMTSLMFVLLFLQRKLATYDIRFVTFVGVDSDDKA